MKLRILVFYLTLTWSYLPSISYSTKVKPDTASNNACASNSQYESAQNISVDECTCQDLHDPTSEVDGNNRSIHNQNVQQYALETLIEDSDDRDVGVIRRPMQVDTQQNSTQSRSDDVLRHRGTTGNSITTGNGLNECLASYDLRTHQRSARSDSASHQRAAKVEMEANETTDCALPFGVQGNVTNPGLTQIPEGFQVGPPVRAVQNGSRNHDQRLAVVNVEANEAEEFMSPNAVLSNTANTFSNQQLSSHRVAENDTCRGRGLGSVMESGDMAALPMSQRYLSSTINTGSNQEYEANRVTSHQRALRNDRQSRETRHFARVSPYHRPTNTTRQAQPGTSRIDAHLSSHRDPLDVHLQCMSRQFARVSLLPSAANPCLNRSEVHRVAQPERATRNDWNAHGQRPADVHMQDNQIPDSRRPPIDGSLRQVSGNVPDHSLQQGRHSQGYTRNPRADIARTDQAAAPRQHLGPVPVYALNLASNENEDLPNTMWGQNSFRGFIVVTPGANGILTCNTGSGEISYMSLFPSHRNEGISPVCSRCHDYVMLGYDLFIYAGSAYRADVLPRHQPVAYQTVNLIHRYQIWEMHPSNIIRRLPRQEVLGIPSYPLLSYEGMVIPSGQYHLRSTPRLGTCGTCTSGVRTAIVRTYLYDGTCQRVCVACQPFFEAYIVESEVRAGNSLGADIQNFAQPSTGYSDNNAVPRNLQTQSCHRGDGNPRRRRPSHQEPNPRRRRPSHQERNARKGAKGRHRT